MDVHPARPLDWTGEEDRELSLADFFACLLKVIRFLRLYPNNHPFISRSLEELHSLWDFVRDDQAEFAFESRSGSIFAGGSEVAHSPRVLTPLKQMLEEKCLDGLTINRSTEFEEFRDLASLLARPRHEIVEKDRIKPVHLAGLKGIRLTTGGSESPTGGGAGRFSASGAGGPGLSALLARALSIQCDTPDSTGDPITHHILSRTPIPLDELDVSEWLRDRPDELARSVAEAVNQLLMGAENPAVHDLTSAFAHSLEPLVAARQEAEHGDFRLMEDTVLRVLSQFDPAFIRRMLPDGPDGEPLTNPLLSKFSARLKLQALKEELLDEGLDEERFRRMLETVSTDEAEAAALVARLTKTVRREPRFKACFTRVAGILQPGLEVRRRQNKVLVLSPDAASRHQLQRELKSAGVELHAVTDGDRLLAEVRRLHPDVVVIEPWLLGIQGLELISQLRRESGANDPIPLVVYSDTAAFQQEFEIMTYPGCRFVLKEEDGEQRVREVIDEILKRKVAVDESQRTQADVEVRPTHQVANRHFVLHGFEIMTYHAPTEKGSTTFFDVVPVSDEKTCILMADGFPLSEDESSCAEIREGLGRLVAVSTEPSLLLQGLNALVWRHFSKRPLIAAQALLLDSRQGSVTACRAGGGKPLKINSRGDTHQLTLPSAIVIGFSRGSAFEATLNEMRLPVEEDDTLLVYSAGITDALGGGDETRALDAIRRETAIAYRESRSVGLPLPGMVQKITDRLHGGEARDRAAIWIRRLPCTATPREEAEQDPWSSFETRRNRS